MSVRTSDDNIDLGVSIFTCALKICWRVDQATAAHKIVIVYMEKLEKHYEQHKKKYKTSHKEVFINIYRI